jgi:S1-C subfamily serine protease
MINRQGSFMKAFYLLLCTLLLMALLSPANSHADPERIFKENSMAVVVVVAYDSKHKPIAQGSGFAVRQDGVIVTSYHVVNKASGIVIKAKNPRFVKMTPSERWAEILEVEGIIYFDRENDLVILKAKFNEKKVIPTRKRDPGAGFLKEDPSNSDFAGVTIGEMFALEKLPVVKLGDIGNANIGEKVYVISSPQGFENTISEGILSGLRDADWGITPLLPSLPLWHYDPYKPLQAQELDQLRYDKKFRNRRKILQITAPVSEGSSGGPVFNKSGEVIGVVTSLIKEGQNLNFAVPVNLIKDEIDNKEVIPLNEWKTGKTEEWQTGSKDKVNRCITIMKERAAALATQDWSYLERLANRYLQNCEGSLDSEDYSEAYCHLAMAHMNRDNAMAALEASEKCIDVFYANFGCHVEKVRALLYLGRQSEARTAFEIAEKIAAHVIKINERKLSEASQPLYKELYSSKQRMLEAQKSHLDSLRRFVYR